jgi:hypothetical protein
MVRPLSAGWGLLVHSKVFLEECFLEMFLELGPWAAVMFVLA